MTTDTFPRDYHQLPKLERAMLEAFANVYFAGDIDKAWEGVLYNHDFNPPIVIDHPLPRKAVIQLHLPLSS